MTEPDSVGGIPEQRPEPAEESDSAVDFFHAIGQQIKLLRERAGLTQRELGQQLGYGEALVSSVERGRRTPQPELLDAVDDLLEAGGLLKAAKADVVKAKTKSRVKHPHWFRDYALLEADAEELNYYSTMAVPGIMQTEAYAREIFANRLPLLSEDEIEGRVSARLARHEILTRWPTPIVTAVIQEWVLRQPLGGPDVQSEQLTRLLTIGRLRNVELQIMPSNSIGHAGMNGPFTLLTPKQRGQIGYLEVQHVSRLITDQAEVQRLAAKYGSLRAAALTPRESLVVIEEILGVR